MPRTGYEELHCADCVCLPLLDGQVFVWIKQKCLLWLKRQVQMQVCSKLTVLDWTGIAQLCGWEMAVHHRGILSYLGGVLTANDGLQVHDSFNDR